MPFDQVAQDIVERQQRPTPELDHDGLLDRRQHGTVGRLGPHRSVGHQRPHTHFATVFEFKLYASA